MVPREKYAQMARTATEHVDFSKTREESAKNAAYGGSLITGVFEFNRKDLETSLYNEKRLLQECDMKDFRRVRRMTEPATLNYADRKPKDLETSTAASLRALLGDRDSNDPSRDASLQRKILGCRLGTDKEGHSSNESEVC